MTEDFWRCVDKLPAGLRLRHLLQTVWSQVTFPQTPPGHFHSPIPAKDEILRNRARIFRSGVDSLPEIVLHEDQQLQLLRRLASHARGPAFCDRRVPWLRYLPGNDYFAGADAMLHAAMLIEFRPRRYVEIGSGFSSALTLDVADLFLPELQCTFIDPFPLRLKKLIRREDIRRAHILQKAVQDVYDEVFSALEAGDILFIDSSHVSKIGSDLNDIVFRILPVLEPGVLIHFHDIFWPFEYPEEEVLRGRSWNEAYLLRAYLANNKAYRIRLFSSWLAKRRPAEWSAALGAAHHSEASSLWLEKVESAECASKGGGPELGFADL